MANSSAPALLVLTLTPLGVSSLLSLRRGRNLRKGVEWESWEGRALWFTGGGRLVGDIINSEEPNKLQGEPWLPHWPAV